MRTRVFFPPLPKFSGGMAVLVALVRHLCAAGHDAALVLREPPQAGMLASLEGVPLCDWAALSLAPEDLWVVPEGWPNALAPGLNARARCLVYVQNWAFMHGTLPPGLNWRSLPVHFLAVSQPVAWYVSETTGCRPEILRPGIDTTLFCPPPDRASAASSPDVSAAVGPAARDAARVVVSAPASPNASAASDPANPLRVAWMPRKNKALASLIRHTVEARQGCGALDWVEIHGKTQAEVAALLRSSAIFLATGFPEGCPLPPLEALASGCLLVGFSGLGGWDYMRQALPTDFPGRFEPWWPRRDAAETSWGGNGLITADADVPAAALALEHAVALVRASGPDYAAIVGQGREAAEHYSLERQKEAVLALWQRAAEGEIWG